MTPALISIASALFLTIVTSVFYAGKLSQRVSSNSEGVKGVEKVQEADMKYVRERLDGISQAVSRMEGILNGKSGGGT